MAWEFPWQVQVADVFSPMPLQHVPDMRRKVHRRIDARARGIETAGVPQKHSVPASGGITSWTTLPPEGVTDASRYRALAG
jgi:DNA-binding transcriptional MocR family regulator